MTRVTKIDNSKSKREKIRLEKKISRIGVNSTPLKQRFLIICEGKNTECEYFDGFRLTSATIKTVGEGKNTLSLVERAIQIRVEEKKKKNIFDQYWCVFDKDSFPNEDFNNAIIKAESNNFNVAYSNQSFEFWLLLHFKLLEGEIHRSNYEDLLTRNFKIKYSKERGFCAKIFNILFPLIDQAIFNAKKVFDNVGNHSSPAKEESSTTVFKLVEELKKYSS
jgi:hypothetical protein